jgi:hypothetical protein
MPWVQETDRVSGTHLIVALIEDSAKLQNCIITVESRQIRNIKFWD